MRMSRLVHCQLRCLVVLSAVLFALGLPQSAFACDPCALYSLSRQQGLEARSVSLTLSEQFTSYDAKNERQYAGRNYERTKRYSTTQLGIGYDLTSWLGLGLNIPVIYREFERVQNYRASEDDETGFGDIASLITVSPYSYHAADQTVLFTLASGVKFPTGDTGSLGDSVEPAPRSSVLAHHPVSISGADGRVLSLGSGSFDYIFASSGYYRQDRLFLLGYVQYTIRTEGDFDYRFANDLVWNAGPGGYLYVSDDATIGIQAALSGETKGKDRSRGEDVEGSAATTLYLGPTLLASFLQRYSAELTAEAPVYKDMDDANIEPDFRIRFSLGARF